MAALQGAQVMPQSLIPVADVVEEAVVRNDAEFLVREVCIRNTSYKYTVCCTDLEYASMYIARH